MGDHERLELDQRRGRAFWDHRRSRAPERPSSLHEGILSPPRRAPYGLAALRAAGPGTRSPGRRPGHAPRRADRAGHLDEHDPRRPCGRRRPAGTAPRRSARRRRGPPRSSRVPVRRWQWAEPAGLDSSGGSRLGCDGRRRPAAGAELGPGGRRRGADRVRRGRLHGPPVARHDRRVAGGLARSHRRAPALAGALRRGDGRGRPGRDRRRLSPERNGQRGGAGVLSGHWQGDEDRAAPRADDPCLGRGAGRCRLRDRRPRRRGRNSHGQGGRRRPPARAGPAVGPAREPALRSRGRRARQRDPPRGRSRAGRHRVRAERARPHRRAGTRASRVSRNGFRYAEGQRLRLRRGEHARTGRPHRPATHLRA